MVREYTWKLSPGKGPDNERSDEKPGIVDSYREAKPTANGKASDERHALGYHRRMTKSAAR